MKNNYPKTCKEVLEVLKYIPINQLKLIPIDVLKQIKQIAEKNEEQIILEFDIMGEPKISRDAKIMILGIYRKYFITEKERNFLNLKLQENENKVEEKKKENYKNVNDIFYNSISKNEIIDENVKSDNIKENIKVYELKENDIQTEKALIIVKKGIFDNIKKIIEKIKNKIIQK